jgi:maleylacetate reductase
VTTLEGGAPMTAGLAQFEYQVLPSRVVFGLGAGDRLAGEVDRLTATRILVVASRDRAVRLRDRLGLHCVGIFTDVRQHVPVEVRAQAGDLARELEADCLVACGGGSAIGLAKAIALDHSVPIVAIPTTYSGSEMTPIWGMTSGRRKQTGRHPGVAPAVVLYDPALTVSLPGRLTASSGMNALAHCVEALYGPAANPVSELLATDGIRRLGAGLEASVRQPDNLAARAEAMLGAHLAGTVLATAGVGIHHQLCHVLGGALGLDHADLNAVLLPHLVRFVTPAVPGEMRRVAAALGADSGDGDGDGGAAGALWDLARRLGAPSSLAELGMPEVELDHVAEAAAPRVSPQPRPASAAELRELLATAWAGHSPAAPAPSSPVAAG